MGVCRLYTVIHCLAAMPDRTCEFAQKQQQWRPEKASSQSPSRCTRWQFPSKSHATFPKPTRPTEIPAQGHKETTAETAADAPPSSEPREASLGCSPRLATPPLPQHLLGGRHTACRSPCVCTAPATSARLIVRPAALVARLRQRARRGSEPAGHSVSAQARAEGTSWNTSATATQPIVTGTDQLCQPCTRSPCTALIQYCSFCAQWPLSALS
jgi:hypothetical protein